MMIEKKELNSLKNSMKKTEKNTTQSIRTFDAKLTREIKSMSKRIDEFNKREEKLKNALKKSEEKNKQLLDNSKSLMEKNTKLLESNRLILKDYNKVMKKQEENDAFIAKVQESLTPFIEREKKIYSESERIMSDSKKLQDKFKRLFEVTSSVNKDYNSLKEQIADRDESLDKEISDANSNITKLFETTKKIDIISQDIASLKEDHKITKASLAKMDKKDFETKIDELVDGSKKQDNEIRSIGSKLAKLETKVSIIRERLQHMKTKNKTTQKSK